jgi:hypothetical protein
MKGLAREYDEGKASRAPKWLVATLIVVGATILGATVFREPIAYAAQTVDATIIGPLDGQGNVKVHEQGIADVHVTNLRNSPVPVDVTDTSLLVQQVGDPITIHLFPGVGTDVYSVPADKRLVIQYIDGLFDPNAAPNRGLFMSVGGTAFFFGGESTVHLNVEGDREVVSEPVTLYTNTTVHLVEGTSVRLSGYLLDD